MKILSNEDIYEIERITTESDGITPVDMVERVAEATAAEIKTLRHTSSNILVVAGWGTNGAYALETARQLLIAGYRPVVYLFNIGGNRLSPQTKVFHDRLAATPGNRLNEITGATPFQWPEPSPSDLIVDGLFGSGLTRPLPRSFQLLVRNINQSGATIVSIDMPSGLFPEWNGNQPREEMVHADVTLAVGFPRLAYMFGDNADVVGDWKIIPMEYNTEAVKNAPATFVMIDTAMCARFLVPRRPFATKADFGNAIIYAGSRGMMGAAVLCAEGALRAGAGKVTVHGPSDGNHVVQTAVPSAMYADDPHATRITDMTFDSKYNAMAIGPGIGRDPDTATALEHAAKAAAAAGRRLVLDADALNIIADRPIILNYLPPLSVITPHAGEFDRMFGESNDDEARLKKAIRVSEDYNLIIVLKGHRTAIIRPDGKIMFNASGTPAMATPGSGDVLTGVITALMAQGLPSEIAAFVGPFIHGVAGELAAATNGEYGVTSQDIAANIGAAIKKIMH